MFNIDDLITVVDCETIQGEALTRWIGKIGKIEGFGAAQRSDNPYIVIEVDGEQEAFYPHEVKLFFTV